MLGAWSGDTMETGLYRRWWRCWGRGGGEECVCLQLVCPGGEKGTGVTVSLQPRAGLLQGRGPEPLFWLLVPPQLPENTWLPASWPQTPQQLSAAGPTHPPTPSPGQASLTQPRGAPPGQVCLSLLIPFSTGADGAHTSDGLLRRAALCPQPGTTPHSVSLS